MPCWPPRCPRPNACCPQVRRSAQQRECANEKRRTRSLFGELEMHAAASRTVFGEAESLRCRNDFPSLRRRIGGHPVAFLDGPGGTQVPTAVIEAIADCYRNRNVNTHGNFPPSLEVDERHLAARAAIADFLGASGPERISIGQN